MSTSSWSANNVKFKDSLVYAGTGTNDDPLTITAQNLDVTYDQTDYLESPETITFTLKYQNPFTAVLTTATVSTYSIDVYSCFDLDIETGEETHLAAIEWPLVYA